MPLTRKHDDRPANIKPGPDYERDVFINCPFDDAYRPLLQAIVFAVLICGFRPRCALEASNAGHVRIQKIMELIRVCRWGIHDISRTEVSANGLPRFNMPLELGLFLGAQNFGSDWQRQKSCLVMDKEPFRYREFLSDIGGQDVVPHQNNSDLAIAVVRNWFRDALPEQSRHLPDGASLADSFRQFNLDLPRICAKLRRTVAKLTFTDYEQAARDWVSRARRQKRRAAPRPKPPAAAKPPATATPRPSSSPRTRPSRSL